MKKTFVLVVLALGMMSFSGCLKSRLQVREEREDQPRVVAGSVREVPTQQSHVVEELKAEITRLTGRLEDLERSRAELAREQNASQREEARKLETRIAELERAQANIIEALKKIQEAVLAGAAANTHVRPSSDAGGGGGDSFERAKALYDAKNYDQAIDALSGYLRHPKAAKTEEATYLRGDAYFQLKQYKKAIVDLSKFPEKYTRSKRMPAALLRIGQSFEALGMKEDAKGFYQELVEKYPKSAEAKKIKAKVK